MQDKTTLGISDTFREFIEALVEEVVINGKPFDAQKKWLRKNSENEGVDYALLEKNLTDFFTVMEERKSIKSLSSQIAARLLAPNCYLSEKAVEKLLSTPNEKKDVHEYIDLGLPSGTLWATCNVGATKPEDYGDYFAWGETSTKSTYNWSTYKYCNGDYDNLTKYCTKSKYGDNGFTDNLTTLEPSDDAAMANWGADWRMPTKEECEELRDNTTNRWMNLNGVNGRIFIANNGNSLFLPAAGSRRDDAFSNAGRFGNYWSVTLCKKNPYHAWYFHFNSGGADLGDYDRYGFSVRPVHKN